MEYIHGVLLLHKLGKPVNEDGLRKVISATGSQVDEAKVKVLVASLQGVNIDEQLASSIAAPTAVASKPSEAKAEKEEEKPTEAAEGLSALFG